MSISIHTINIIIVILTFCGKEIFTSRGKEFFTYSGKQFFTFHGKQIFTLPLECQLSPGDPKDPRKCTLKTQNLMLRFPDARKNSGCFSR